MRISARAYASVATAALAAMASPAMALSAEQPAEQAAPAPEAVATEAFQDDIVVVARRRQENLQDVPLAVTAVSGDLLQSRGIVDATQLNQLVPALRVEAFNSPTSTNIGIRGVRPTEIAPGQDASVGVIFGDIAWGFTIGINPLMFDLQSVQVLKGPQGTLFGRNTTGGVIILAPQRPTDVLEGSVSLGATFFDNGAGMRGTAVLNVPVTDGISIRGGIDYVARDGYVRNVTDRANTAFYETIPNTGITNFRDLNDQDQISWRLSALVTPAPGIESYFLYQGTRLRGDGTAYRPTAVNPMGGLGFLYGGAGGRPSAFDELARAQALAADDFWTAQSNGRTFIALDQWSVSNTTSIELADGITLKNIIGYRHFDRNEQQDLEGFPFEVLEASIPDRGHEFVEELQLQGSLGQFDFTAGLFYTSQHIIRDNNRVVLGGVDVGFSENDSRAESYAAYFQGTWRVPGVEGLAATAGIRFTHDDRYLRHTGWVGLDNQGSCALTSNGVRLPDNACVVEGEASFDTPTWNANLSYQVDPDTLIYASYSRGYRAGGFNYTATGPADFGPFNPEYVDTFELGLKRDWQLGGDAMLRTNLAAFYSQYRDIQRFVTPLGQVLPSISNASSAKIEGLEAEVLLRPWRGAQLGVNYAYTNPRYDDFVTAQGDFTDNEFAQTSRHQLTIFGSVDLPLPERIGTVSLRADYYYQSRVYYNDTAQGPGFGPLDSQSQPGYGILNLGIDWREVGGQPVDVSLFVNNATATEYSPFGIILYQSIGYNGATIGDPRVIGVQTTLRF